MEYALFGPYWVFCVARAIMTGSFGDPQYGLFRNADSLVLGIFGFVVWFLMAAIFFAPLGAIIEAFLDNEQEKL